MLRITQPIIQHLPVKNSSKTKTSCRIQLLDASSSPSIHSLSTKVKSHKPGFSPLNSLGIRKRVYIHVKHGYNGEGYVSLSAESLRKNLGMKKSTFYAEVRQTDGDMTAFLEKKFAGQWHKEGLAYINGKKDVKPNAAQAFHCFQQSAALGSPAGHTSLARCYSYGFGTKKNSKKAKEEIIKMLDACTTEAQRHANVKILRDKKVPELEKAIQEWGAQKAAAEQKPA